MARQRRRHRRIWLDWVGLFFFSLTILFLAAVALLAVARKVGLL